MLSMTDSYGDGWNGNHWRGFGADCSISDPSGSNGECAFTVPRDITETITANGGSWEHEIGWTLNCDGQRKASGGATNGKSITLREGAECSLRMNDSYGDGWNGNKWRGFGADCSITDP